MARFPRPTGALSKPTDLKAGDVVWEVLGLLTPCKGGPYKIERAPIPFKDHPSYHHSSSQGAELVFDKSSDITELGGRWVTYWFCGDCNLLDRSHNDNYLFRTEQEADAAVAYFQQCWKGNSALAEEEREWRRRWREMDSYDH